MDRPDREKIALKLPRLWCNECPYKETMHLCVEGKPCRWQLDYADELLVLMPDIEESIIQAKKEQYIVDWEHEGEAVKEAKKQVYHQIMDFFKRNGYLPQDFYEGLKREAKREERERIAEIAWEYLNAGICDICYEDNCGDEFSCTKGEDGEPCECHQGINEARSKLEQALKGEVKEGQ